MHILTVDSLPRVLSRLRQPYQRGYLAMHSSVFGGIVTDPVLMMVPFDDHMVHRGDGVFEAFKCVHGSIYNLSAHLKRLQNSAHAVSLRLPGGIAAIRRRVMDTVRAGKTPDCIVRLFVSRGPGSFGVNPYDSPAPQLYVVVTRPPPPFLTRHPAGARVVRSSLRAKDPAWARVKSCNYLPNALMKKQAVEGKADFAVAFDADGRLAEGASENMGIVSRDRRLLFPRLTGILKGTTMMRVADLARRLVRDGVLSGVAFADVTEKDIFRAREVLVTGTTIDVLPVVEFDGHRVADGKPGPVWKRLSALLAEDMRSHRAFLTPVLR